MLKIPLSQTRGLGFIFENAVADFVQAKKDHLLTEGQPAPTAIHPLVEYAVRRIPGSYDPETGNQQSDDFVADYEIVDDSPPPPTLEEKKAALAQKSMGQATAAANAILPPLKARLINFQVNDARLRKAKGQASDEDEAVLSDHEARSQKQDAIWRHLALLESQIHDLTEDQVDVWQGAPFP